MPAAPFRFALLIALVAALAASAPPRPLAAQPALESFPPPASASAPPLLPPAVSAGCFVYPIAISQPSLDGVPGRPAPVPLPEPNAEAGTIRTLYPSSVFTATDSTTDSYFRFARWSGDHSADALKTSLYGGGNLGQLFTEAITPANGLLERGDYVAIPVAGNQVIVDELLDSHISNRTRMALPVIDSSRGIGGGRIARVLRFATIRLLAYQRGTSGFMLTFALVGDDADYACFRQSQARATVGQTVTFTPTMPLTDGLALGWTFGDGAGSAALTATHIYSAAGTFQATLTVTNARSVAAAARSSVIVDPALRVDFTASAARFGQAAVFHGAVGVGPPPTGVVTGTWDFGDGATAAGYDVTHAYAAVGTYEVTFSATDRNGFAVARRKPVTVAGERVWLPQTGRRSALAPPPASRRR